MSELTCIRCGGVLDQGFMLDRLQDGYATGKWVAGVICRRPACLMPQPRTNGAVHRTQHDLRSSLEFMIDSDTAR